MDNLHHFVENTLLGPATSADDVEHLMNEASRQQYFGICVPPFWVKKCRRDLNRGDLRVITVIGFPMGYQMTQTKIHEIKLALEEGADELDVVINLSAFKSGMPWVKIELAKCAQVIHEAGRLMKVIIDTSYLSSSELDKLAAISGDAGTDFVSTSTWNATEEKRQLNQTQRLRKILPDTVGIKVAGAIYNHKNCQDLINAGADRLSLSFDTHGHATIP